MCNEGTGMYRPSPPEDGHLQPSSEMKTMKMAIFSVVNYSVYVNRRFYRA